MATDADSTRKVMAAMRRHRGATAAEIVSKSGVAPAAARKALKFLEGARLAQRAPARVGERSAADRLSLVGEDGDAEATFESVMAVRGERLPPGALRAVVLRYLQTQGGAAHSAPAIAKILRRSPGAVSGALAKLVEEGAVTQVGDRPRRYRCED